MNETTTEALVPGVLCVRVSTMRQVKEGTSLEKQVEIGTKSLQNNGCYVAAVKRDEGTSGALYLSRKGIQESIALIESGQAKVLCITAVDRGGRDVEAVRDIARRVERAGGRLLIADQGFADFNSYVGRAVLTFQAVSAEMVRGSIRASSIDGRFKKAKQGEQPSRNVHPYGFHIVQKVDVIRGTYPADMLGHYVTIPAEIEALAKMRAWFCEPGVSLRDVSRRLFAEGIKTKKGNDVWNPGVIGRILANPLYLGEAIFGRHEWNQDETRLLEGYKRARFFVPRSESEWVRIPILAVAEREEWEACVAKLNANPRTLSGNPKYRFLLTSMIACPLCGGSMTGTRNASNAERASGREGTRHYKCSAATRYEAGGSKCEAKSMKADEVESLVMDGLCWLLENPSLFGEAEHAWESARRKYDARQTDTTDDTRAEIDSRLSAIRAEEEATAKAQIAGVIKGADPAIYASFFEAFAKERAELMGKRAALPTRREKGDLPPAPSFDFFLPNLPGVVRGVLKGEDVPLEQRRALLLAAIDYVVPTRENPKRGDGYGKRSAPTVTEAAIYLRMPEDSAILERAAGTKRKPNAATVASRSMRATVARYVIRVRLGEAPRLVIEGGAQ